MDAIDGTRKDAGSVIAARLRNYVRHREITPNGPSRAG
jgi:hypothetical protein